MVPCISSLGCMRPAGAWWWATFSFLCQIHTECDSLGPPELRSALMMLHGAGRRTLLARLGWRCRPPVWSPLATDSRWRRRVAPSLKRAGLSAVRFRVRVAGWFAPHAQKNFFPSLGSRTLRRPRSQGRKCPQLIPERRSLESRILRKRCHIEASTKEVVYPNRL